MPARDWPRYIAVDGEIVDLDASITKQGWVLCEERGEP